MQICFLFIPGPVYENPGLVTKGSEPRHSNELTYENASSVAAAKQKESAENIYENNELPKTKDPERVILKFIYLDINIYDYYIPINIPFFVMI